MTPRHHSLWILISTSTDDSQTNCCRVQNLLPKMKINTQLKKFCRNLLTIIRNDIDLSLSIRNINMWTFYNTKKELTKQLDDYGSLSPWVTAGCPTHNTSHNSIRTTIKRREKGKKKTSEGFITPQKAKQIKDRPLI
ncbi:hypothetical protein NPIL_483291 [Nephila pilipes]|uniref:Uncharacterized protein n=1 Tax=Nephila pilipes TaxID=299642 RepID=A0A8X6U1C9_NEPPI|nr:hypothetical protein NPIL_483291 [Nephila pilipes]